MLRGGAAAAAAALAHGGQHATAGGVGCPRGAMALASSPPSSSSSVAAAVGASMTAAARCSALEAFAAEGAVGREPAVPARPFPRAPASVLAAPRGARTAASARAASATVAAATGGAVAAGAQTPPSPTAAAAAAAAAVAPGAAHGGLQVSNECLSIDRPRAAATATAASASTIAPRHCHADGVPLGGMVMAQSRRRGRQAQQDARLPAATAGPPMPRGLTAAPRGGG